MELAKAVSEVLYWITSSSGSISCQCHTYAKLPKFILVITEKLILWSDNKEVTKIRCTVFFPVFSIDSSTVQYISWPPTADELPPSTDYMTYNRKICMHLLTVN
jgi:hypothetical protein